jgi:hypothetical protein
LFKKLTPIHGPIVEKIPLGTSREKKIRREVLPMKVTMLGPDSGTAF